jgi:hypothetical protein
MSYFADNFSFKNVARLHYLSWGMFGVESLLVAGVSAVVLLLSAYYREIDFDTNYQIKSDGGVFGETFAFFLKIFLVLCLLQWLWHFKFFDKGICILEPRLPNLQEIQKIQELGKTKDPAMLATTVSAVQKQRTQLQQGRKTNKDLTGYFYSGFHSQKKQIKTKPSNSQSSVGPVGAI